MSKIGKLPVAIPAGVTVKVEPGFVRRIEAARKRQSKC